MAKAEAVRPAGEREQELYDLIEEKFGNKAEFFRRVAGRTGKTSATEKSAYYRIIRGEAGTTLRWRLGHYAAVLALPPKSFVVAWEEATEAADVTVLPLNPTPRELREVLLAMVARIDRLVDRVEGLERRAQPKHRRAGTRT